MFSVTADQLRRAFGTACVLALINPALADEQCSLTYERATAIGRAAHAAAINADPPVTTYSAERILVIERPDDDLVMVALVHDGCADKRIETTPSKWSELRRGAIGDAL